MTTKNFLNKWLTFDDPAKKESLTKLAYAHRQNLDNWNIHELYEIQILIETLTESLGLDQVPDIPFLTSEQKILIAHYQWMLDVDFIPNDLSEYEALPAPFNKSLVSLLNIRKERFNELSKSRKASFE